MKTIILKVGGSLLSRSENQLFNFEYANKLKGTLVPFTQEDYQFILCVGGGFLARKYQQLFNEHNIPVEDQHQLGVAIVNLNAEGLQSVFKDVAPEGILRYEDYDDSSPIDLNADPSSNGQSKPFLITAAGSPGHSSDWNTVKLATRSGSSLVISLKNVDGVYTADPKKDPNAKRIDRLTWDEYLNIIGNPKEHIPGANYPVDPIAARLAKENNLKFYIVHGDDLANLTKALKEEEFSGSVIA